MKPSLLLLFTFSYIYIFHRLLLDPAINVLARESPTAADLERGHLFGCREPLDVRSVTFR
jgi:hypothetical protein